MNTKPPSWNELKQSAEKRIEEQTMKSLGTLSYLVEAQREVLEFELGVLDDVLKLIRAGVATRQSSGS